MLQETENRILRAAASYGVDISIIPPEVLPHLDKLDRVAEILSIDVEKTLQRITKSPELRDPRVAEMMVLEHVAWQLHDGAWNKLESKDRIIVQGFLRSVLLEPKLVEGFRVLLPKKKVGVDLEAVLRRHAAFRLQGRDN